MAIFTLSARHECQAQPSSVMQKDGASRQYSVASDHEEATDRRQETRATSIQPVSSLQPLTSSIVGRDAELSRLHSLFAKALEGQRQIVFVTGEPGIGKSTLVDMFLSQLRERDEVRITSGQCVEQYGPGEAYMPLLEATTRLCRGPGREKRIEGLKRYAPSWLMHMSGLVDAQELALLQERTQGTSRERMLREMAEAAELFATRRGLVLVLEDLHWSDVATLEWLSYMARRRESAKLMIIGTYRPVEMLASGSPARGIVQELSARGGCVEVRVPSLEETIVQEYVARRCGGTLPPIALATAIYRRTEGNPLFMRTVVDYLLAHGVINESEGHWHFRTADNSLTTSVPDTIRQLIEKQVERAPVEVQQVLAVASVVGVEFTVAEVAAGLQSDSETIELQCERLAQTGQFLRMEGVAEWPDGTLSGRYSFLHAVYREVIAARVGGTRCIQWHRRVAERIEAAYGERVGEMATALAVHFEEGREFSRAIAYLERAGRIALQRSANIEATRHLTHALTLLASLPASAEHTRQELTLRLALGTPLLALNGYGALEVRRHYQQARTLCHELGDPPDLFPVLWGLWLSHAVAGELSAAEEFGSQLSQFAAHQKDDALSLQAHHALWTTLVARGELVTCQSHVEQGLQLYQVEQHHSQTFVYGGHDPGACCRIHGGYLYWLLGYPDRALQLSQEALTLGEELAHGQTRAWALSGKAMIHQFRGEVQQAQQAAEAAMTVSLEQQFALWAAYSPPIRGWAMAMQGKIEEGIAQALSGLAALQATGTGIWQSQFLALLASAYGEAGRPWEGLRTIDEALDAVARNGEHFYEAELYRLRGELMLQNEAQGWGLRAREDKGLTSSVQSPVSENPSTRHLTLSTQEEAERCFFKALDIARQQHAKSWELRAAVSLARLWQHQNKVNEAREVLQEVYAWFTEGFETKDLQEAETLLVALGGTAKSPESKACPELSQRDQSLSELGVANRSECGVDSKALQSPDSEPSTPDLSAPASNPQPLAANTFRPEGEYWTVSFAGETCRFKDARGLHYISHLLHHPHQEVHVITLITMSAERSEEPIDGPTFRDVSLSSESIADLRDPGDILDPQARAAYRQRLSDLREELTEAQRFHDLGRSGQLAAEIDVLSHELSSAVGLGGRARRIGSAAERARVNITRAIKIALRKISEHHVVLGQHLTTTIKTGTYCSYTPDTRLPIIWHE